jgi:hypothetical protein
MIMTAALSERPGLLSSSVRAQDRCSWSVRKPLRGLALLHSVSGARESRTPPVFRLLPYQVDQCRPRGKDAPRNPRPTHLTSRGGTVR